MKLLWIVLLSGVLIYGVALGQTKPLSATVAGSDWPSYGHDKAGTRYSPLTQITPKNVNRLKPSWVFHMRPPSSREAAFAESEVTPLIIDGRMYIATPYGQIVALDPEEGSAIWSYKLPGASRPSTRGVEYFPGDAQTPPQIVFGTDNGTPAILISLDAKTGKPNPSFGTNGIVNLATQEILHGLPGNDALSSPPVVYKNLVITGGRTQEAPTKGPAGDVRAWDIHTGKLVWTFKSVPQPGERFHDTWAGDTWKDISGVNVWSLMTVDTERGVLYMPFGQPTGSGAERPGDNLFSSSIVAVDASTGKYLWHFQLTHHDIFDYDAEVPPVLFDVQKDGETIPGIAAMNKAGLLFILNRVTGQPLFGVEERPVPQDAADYTSPTQPFPLKPRPLARMQMSPADIATVTPELEAECKRLIAESKSQMGPAYFKPSAGKSVRFPGSLGGPNWGATAFNPALGYLIVASSNLGAANLGAGNRFKEPKSNMMCQQPPWGTLAAVNVNTADVVWEVPVGVTDNAPPDKQNTGRPMLGGPITTASGLIFMGATDDARFRAFDVRTGNELWTFKLGAAAHSVPSTYMGQNGKQYVVVSSTGGSFLLSPLRDDSVTAFTLPD